MSMLQQAYLLKICVQKALMDISLSEGESFSNNEIKMISAIIKIKIMRPFVVGMQICILATL